MIRRTAGNKCIDLLLAPRLCGVEEPDVDKVEDPILRSGSEWGKVARSTTDLPSVELTSLPPPLCVRRSIRGIERRSRNPMSTLGQRRWWCDSR